MTTRPRRLALCPCARALGPNTALLSSLFISLYLDVKTVKATSEESVQTYASLDDPDHTIVTEAKLAVHVLQRAKENILEAKRSKRNTLTKSMQNQMHMLWGNLFLRKTLLGRYVHAIHTCA